MKKIIYRNKLFPGVVFNSYEEAMKAEEGMQERGQEAEAMEAIGKYNRGGAQTSIGMAEKAGPDAWATAPREDLQKISEGQVLSEMGMSSPLGLARGYGITANPSEPAQKFVSSLKDETRTTGSSRSPSVFELKARELKRIREMPEGPEKEAAFDDFIMNSATGTAYSLSDKGIRMAGKRASTTEYAKIPPQIEKKEAETKVVNEFEDATTLRKEFDALSKDYNKVRDSYGRVITSGKDPSAAGDLALIFNYMKILDPGSVVRESEFANAAATGSFGDRLKAAGQKLLRGERLSDDMRADFLNVAKSLYEKHSEIQQVVIDKYTKLAQKRGIPPEDVVSDIQSMNETKVINGITYEKQEDGKWHRQ
jgi:hypothetical protein